MTATMPGDAPGPAPGEWSRLRDLVADALELPAAERVGYLREATPDRPDLRQAAAELLRSAESADGFLDTLDLAAAAALVGRGDELAPGTRVGPYRIVRLLGRGGMGVVYLAEDTRLDRVVALKFLERGTATAAARERLVSEARAAAALDHPGIAVVHDIGETEAGEMFIAMAYCEGRTLAELIADGPRPVDETIALGRQIAGALAAAHARGIVHRDIKPSNVIVGPNGNARIVDFGIALIADRPAGSAPATPGTVAYMSPEQTRSEPLDARTDLWSLGVVMYQMLTGRLPFSAPPGGSVVDAIRTAAPPPLASLRPEVPTDLERLVHACLSRSPSARPSSAADVAAALTEPTPRSRGAVAALVGGGLLAAAGAVYLAAGFPRGAPPADLPPIRVAVLPLAQRDTSADGRYLAGALTYQLIARLSASPELRVTAYRSVRQLAGRDTRSEDMARRLGVDAILAAELSTAGERIDVSARLVETGGREIWRGDYQSDAGGIAGVERAIVEEVAGALGRPLGAETRSAAAARATGNETAYLEYLRGRYRLQEFSTASIEQARDHFQRALDRDPAFAAAWSGLADAYISLGYLAALPPSETGPRARAAAERALEIDPGLAEAHASLATVLTDHYYQWEAAERHFERALELGPSYAAGYQLYAEFLRDQGRFGDALAAIEQAQVLDPLSPFLLVVEGIVLHMARRPDEALAQYRRALAMRPGYRPAWFYNALTHLQRGSPAEALASLATADPGERFPDAVALRGVAYAAMGDRDAAHRALARLERVSSDRYVSPFLFAIVHAGLGDRDRAIELLNRASDERSWFVRLLKVEPALDPLRADPRFQELLARVGLVAPR